MSGTASFMSFLVPLDRGVHFHVATPLLRHLVAECEIIAGGSHPRLALQLLGPIAQVETVPRRLRFEWRQAEPLPDRLGVLHELALGERDRREGALERGVDQHGRALAAVARA